MIRSPQRQRGGFTLIEMMISVAVLVFILLIVTSFMNAVSATWTSGEQTASTFQDGRAILELMGRELTQAAMSPSLQFVVMSSAKLPAPAASPSPAPSPPRPNSDSIFWQASLTYRVSGTATPLTSLCEVGYYIDTSYNLKRFVVPPSDATNFQVFANEPNDSGAAWVTINSTTTSTIATGAVGLWVRCYDANGDLIPWAGNAGVGNGTATSIRYNSAAHIRPATLGTSNSFIYTGASTARTNVLPNAVELTLVLIDDKTLKKSSLITTMIPALPAATSPSGVPAAISSFNNSLITNKVSTARTFTSRVVLPNASRQ
jgi:prepilin-type N-terminal cleavage/methylation domain-containing protein